MSFLFASSHLPEPRTRRPDHLEGEEGDEDGMQQPPPRAGVVRAFSHLPEPRPLADTSGPLSTRPATPVGCSRPYVDPRQTAGRMKTATQITSPGRTPSTIAPLARMNTRTTLPGTSPALKQTDPARYELLIKDPQAIVEMFWRKQLDRGREGVGHENNQRPIPKGTRYGLYDFAPVLRSLGFGVTLEHLKQWRQKKMKGN